MLRVIIVDDEVDVRDTIVAVVDWHSFGIEIVGTAGDGLTALKLIEEQNPDVVLIDIQMPGITGLEVIQRIRVEDIRHPEFIIISGFDEFSYAQQALRLSISEYLLKPVTAMDIICAIQRSVKRIDVIRSIQQPGGVVSAVYNEYLLHSDMINMTTIKYPLEQENNLLKDMKIGSYEDAFSSLLTFHHEAKERNDKQTSALIGSYYMLYAEICRFLAARNIALQTPFLAGDSLNVDNIEDMLFSSVNDIITEFFNQADENKISNVYVKQAMDYIDNNYQRNLTQSEVARYVAVSNAYLSGLFSRAIGISFVDYIQKVRVNAAKELLITTTLRTYEIADKIGFEDAKYFSQVFKKMEGMSPSEFRNHAAKPTLYLDE